MLENLLETGKILIHENTKNKILILDNRPIEQSRSANRISVWAVWNITHQQLENITLIDLYRYETYIEGKKGEKNDARK